MNDKLDRLRWNLPKYVKFKRPAEGCFIEELMLVDGAGGEVATVFAISKVAALAYLMFNMFSPPCFAAIGAMRSEMKSSKWLIGGISLQFAIGFVISYLVYTIGTLCVSPDSLNVTSAVMGGIATFIIIMVVMILVKNSHKKKVNA